MNECYTDKSTQSDWGFSDAFPPQIFFGESRWTKALLGINPPGLQIGGETHLSAKGIIQPVGPKCSSLRLTGTSKQTVVQGFNKER